MGRSSNPNPRGRTRISRPVLGAAISAGVAILIAALLHANALAVGTYIDDSAELARTEAALVATQLSLRTLSQAVLVAEDVSLGVADPGTAATAAAEAARVTADLETGSRASASTHTLPSSPSIDQKRYWRPSATTRCAPPAICWPRTVFPHTSNSATPSS